MTAASLRATERTIRKQLLALRASRLGVKRITTGQRWTVALAATSGKADLLNGAVAKLRGLERWLGSEAQG